jgi:hypothetical protein
MCCVPRPGRRRPRRARPPDDRSKNDDAENLGRGQSKFTGLLRVTLQVAFSTASCNVRHQVKFYADTDGDHPLLDVRRPDDGWSSAVAR